MVVLLGRNKGLRGCGSLRAFILFGVASVLAGWLPAASKSAMPAASLYGPPGRLGGVLGCAGAPNHKGRTAPPDGLRGGFRGEVGMVGTVAHVCGSDGRQASNCG